MTPLLLLAAAPVSAQQPPAIGSIEQLRVIGPVAVTIAVGSPRVSVSGDPAAVAVDVEGGTLVVRRAGRVTTGDADLPVVSIRTPALRTVSVDGAARVTADRLSGARVTVLLNGPGEVAVAAVAADELAATVVGEGRLSLAGRVPRARLVSTGDARVEAGALAADELTLRLDGGEMRAQARYQATVTAVGKARATVLGHPICTVRAPAGAVTCGVAPPVGDGAPVSSDKLSPPALPGGGE